MNREQTFLLLLVALAAVASLLVVLPFLEWVIAALLLAYVLRPAHRRLACHVGDRVAAIAVIAGATVLLVAPLAWVGSVVFRDAQDLARGETGLDLGAIEAALPPAVADAVELQPATNRLGQVATDVFFGSAGQLVSFLTTALIGLTLVIFLVYYVLIDGPAFVQWAVDVAPMDDAVAHELVSRMDRMTWGVVAGHIFVAIVQGVIGGVGLYATGVPSPFFWSFVMVLTALFPIVGAFLVWGPAAGYLYLVGDVTAAIGLALWGLIVVSLVDNYLRSIAIDQSAEVNPGVILVGVVGGIYTFGAVGLFVGPIVIGLLAATIRAFDDHFDALSYETPPPEPPSSGRLSWLETRPRAARDAADAPYHRGSGNVDGSGDVVDGDSDDDPADGENATDGENAIDESEESGDHERSLGPSDDPGDGPDRDRFGDADPAED